MEHKLVDGIKIPLTAQEIAQRQAEATAWANGAFDRAMASLRVRRNALLTSTDFYALSDNTLSLNMKNYRQSLRDITEGLTNVNQVNAVVWPTKPLD